MGHRSMHGDGMATRSPNFHRGIGEPGLAISPQSSVLAKARFSQLPQDADRPLSLLAWELKRHFVGGDLNVPSETSGSQAPSGNGNSP